MTYEQVKKILDDRSIPMDEWVSLEPFQAVSLKADCNISVDPYVVNFFFSSSGILFIRYLCGHYEECTSAESDTGQRPYYIYFSEGTTYYREKIANYGVESQGSSAIGWFHSVVSYSTIVGIYDSNTVSGDVGATRRELAFRMISDPSPYVDTLGGITTYDDKQCYIEPAAVWTADANGYTKRYFPVGTAKVNPVAGKPLALFTFRPAGGIALPEAYLSIDSTAVSDPVIDDSMEVVIPLDAAADHIVILSFDGTKEYKYMISVKPTLLP